MSTPAGVGLIRSLLSPQDDKDLVHEFVIAEGLTCLIKVGAEADQNYQNYILRGTQEVVSPFAHGALCTENGEI